MKTILYVALLLMVVSTAFANDEPVPGNTLLTSLPDESRFYVKKDVLDGTAIHREYSKFTNNLNQIFHQGDVLPITTISKSSISYYIHYDTGTRGKGSINLSMIGIYDGSKLPETVDDFNKWVGSYFVIIYDDPAHYDPYPGMDKSMVVDIVMTKITAALKANEYKKALKDFALLEKLGTPLPESFYYYYTDALAKTGKNVEARSHAGDYLKKYGKKGKYYAQIVEIMSRL